MLAYLTDLPLAVRAARQRASYRHADTGAVAAPSMSYETAVQRYVGSYNSYAIVKTLPVSYTVFSSTFLNDAISSEYHTHRAPRHTCRVYSYIISLGVTILRLTLPVTHLEPL